MKDHVIDQTIGQEHEMIGQEYVASHIASAEPFSSVGNRYAVIGQV